MGVSSPLQIVYAVKYLWIECWAVRDNYALWMNPHSTRDFTHMKSTPQNACSQRCGGGIPQIHKLYYGCYLIFLIYTTIRERRMDTIHLRNEQACLVPNSRD